MSEEMRRMIPKKYYTNHYLDITFKTTFHNCVLKALQNRQWRQIQTTGWSLNWSEKERVNDVFQEGLSANQRTNHFRLWSQLCRKDMMIKNIRKYKRQLQKEKNFVQQQWDFVPLTFFLPSQYIMFSESFKKKGGLWIMKPTSRCQGEGIFIIDKLSQVAPFSKKAVMQNNNLSAPTNPKPPVPSFKTKKQEQKNKIQQKQSDQSDAQDEKIIQTQSNQPESYLIQQYISQPLLFGSKKFDLRIYCLCTNYSQLTAWLYRSGFARFTHQPYNTENIQNLQSHLTNVKIQMQSQNYDEKRGGKWLLNKFKQFLLSKYDPVRVDWCFTEIKNIIIRSLQSVQKNILPSKNSFQLYGYDFMIDVNLKPWLIQINGGPSMTANTQFDQKLKCGLIDDVLTIVDLQGILQGNEMAVGGFDLIIQKGVKIVQMKHSAYTSFLGAKNQRIKVIKNIIKKFMMRKKVQQQKQNDENEFVEPKMLKKKQDGKQKLLPSFYYKRKHDDDGTQMTKKQLIEQLQILAQNDDYDNTTLSNCKFVPLKNY